MLTVATPRIAGSSGNSTAAAITPAREVRNNRHSCMIIYRIKTGLNQPTPCCWVFLIQSYYNRHLTKHLVWAASSRTGRCLLERVLSTTQSALISSQPTFAGNLTKNGGTRNTASERVMQKVGMHREGVFQDYFRCKNSNNYDDVVMYSILHPFRSEKSSTKTSPITECVSLYSIAQQ